MKKKLITFLNREIIGSSIVLIPKLAMIVKCFSSACDALYNAELSFTGHLTSEFTRFCNEILRQSCERFFLIDIEEIEFAEKIVDYFNLHKLLLMDYNCDPNLSSFENLTNLLNI